MYNYRIEIEYDGGRYDGWQRLGKDASTNTIESRLCEIIARMTGETVDMYVGSRTEKGVHALCQTAYFKLEKEVKAELEKTNNVEAAAAVGTVVAKRALEKGIKTVVYDRGGFIYAGKIKALAEAAREAGLEF